MYDRHTYTYVWQYKCITDRHICMMVFMYTYIHTCMYASIDLWYTYTMYVSVDVTDIHICMPVFIYDIHTHMYASVYVWQHKCMIDSHICIPEYIHQNIDVWHTYMYASIDVWHTYIDVCQYRCMTYIHICMPVIHVLIWDRPGQLLHF